MRYQCRAFIATILCFSLLPCAHAVESKITLSTGSVDNARYELYQQGDIKQISVESDSNVTQGTYNAETGILTLISNSKVSKKTTHIEINCLATEQSDSFHFLTSSTLVKHYSSPYWKSDVFAEYSAPTFLLYCKGEMVFIANQDASKYARKARYFNEDMEGADRVFKDSIESLLPSSVVQPLLDLMNQTGDPNDQEGTKNQVIALIQLLWNSCPGSTLSGIVINASLCASYRFFTRDAFSTIFEAVNGYRPSI